MRMITWWLTKQVVVLNIKWQQWGTRKSNWLHHVKERIRERMLNCKWCRRWACPSDNLILFQTWTEGQKCGLQWRDKKNGLRWPRWGCYDGCAEWRRHTCVIAVLNSTSLMSLMSTLGLPIIQLNPVSDMNCGPGPPCTMMYAIILPANSNSPAASAVVRNRNHLFTSLRKHRLIFC